MPKPFEPTVVINGHTLSPEQSRALRLAVEGELSYSVFGTTAAHDVFHMDPDHHVPRVSRYRTRLEEVQALIANVEPTNT